MPDKLLLAKSRLAAGQPRAPSIYCAAGHYEVVLHKAGQWHEVFCCQLSPGAWSLVAGAVVFLVVSPLKCPCELTDTGAPSVPSSQVLDCGQGGFKLQAGLPRGGIVAVGGGRVVGGSLRSMGVGVGAVGQLAGATQGHAGGHGGVRGAQLVA